MSTETTLRQFPCVSCGAKLEYAPGTVELKCPYCAAENQIKPEGAAVEEEDLLAALRSLRDVSEHHEQLVVKCGSCGSQTTLPDNVTAMNCLFCGSSLVTQGEANRQIRPKSLLPFRITLEQASQAYQGWLSSLWFAPTSLKRDAITARLKGVYIPAWTYDCNTTSDYTGERGEDYWETETYWDTETYTETEDGKSVTKTRQVQKTREVRKTRWWPVSGRVHNAFDDLLVLATRSLPRKQACALEPWDIKDLVPYQEEYLAGFVCQSYEVDLEQGFGEAKQQMEPTIQSTICRDIGGDHQRIGHVSTAYQDITFKHLLLPVWIASYRYGEQVYRFLVNARTGEVQGERPWGWVKITLMVLAIVAVILVIVILAQGRAMR